MPELPATLRSRFNLYLNVLPVVDAVGQLVLFTVGVTLVLVAIVRAALIFSRTMQISGSQRRHSNSGQQQHRRAAYAQFGAASVSLTGADGSCEGGASLDYDVYEDDEEDNDYDYDDYETDIISYEMSEKCIRNGDDVILYEVDLCEASTTTTTVPTRADTAANEYNEEAVAFMLDNEHALSEDDDDDDDDGADIYDSDMSSNAAGGSAGQPSMSYEDSATVVELPSLVS